MTIQACAELVAPGIPCGFAWTMAAPLAREKLLAALCFQLEVARAPVNRRAMIAEMRLPILARCGEEGACRKAGPP